MLFFQRNSSPLFCISRSSSVSLFFSLSFASLSPTLSFSLPFAFSIFQICGHDYNPRQHGYRNNFRFPFCRCWLFNCLCFIRRGWPCNFRQKSLELHLGWRTCWLSYFTLLHLWCGQTGGRSDERSRDYKTLPKFLGCVANQIFLPTVLRCAWERSPL